MDASPTFWSYIHGSLTLPHFLAGMSFVGMGLLITLLLDVVSRDRHSRRTPPQWSWRFFWRDNLLRFFLNLLTAMALIRFWRDMQGEEIGMFHCFCIGIAFDSLYILLKNVRKRIVKHENNEPTDKEAIK
jgi:hypothetical protein